jgi:bacteriocin-like protein
MAHEHDQTELSGWAELTEAELAHVAGGGVASEPPIKEG